MRSLIRALLVAALACTACASPQPATPSSNSMNAAPPSSATASETADRNPTGVAWERKITAEEPKKFHITKTLKDLDFAPDGTLLVLLKFGDDSWTQFANYGGGTQQPGDGGTYRYDEAGNLLLTTGSDGSTTRFAWDINDDRLTLRMLDVALASSGDLAIVRMMTEGVYRQVDS